MGRKLLFISKYPDIVQEFLAAMDGKDLEIDVASNGIEAAKQLKMQEYQVVVTGLSLDGYNGEQIISYLNKHFPSTVCIIYTTTISPAQLHFFINEHDVFRVFLRPVDFQSVFYVALEEAFEKYELREAEREEELRRSEEAQNHAQEIVKIQQRLGLQLKMEQTANRYMKRLTAMTIREYADGLDEAQKAELQALEWEIADLCCQRGERTTENLIKAEELCYKLKKITTAD